MECLPVDRPLLVVCVAHVNDALRSVGDGTERVEGLAGVGLDFWVAARQPAVMTRRQTKHSAGFTHVVAPPDAAAVVAGDAAAGTGPGAVGGLAADGAEVGNVVADDGDGAVFEDLAKDLRVAKVCALGDARLRGVGGRLEGQVVVLAAGLDAKVAVVVGVEHVDLGGDLLDGASEGDDVAAGGDLDVPLGDERLAAGDAVKVLDGRDGLDGLGLSLVGARLSVGGLSVRGKGEILRPEGAGGQRRRSSCSAS